VHDVDAQAERLRADGGRAVDDGLEPQALAFGSASIAWRISGSWFFASTVSWSTAPRSEAPSAA
jgi:hypothetical protein